MNTLIQSLFTKLRLVPSSSPLLAKTNPELAAFMRRGMFRMEPPSLSLENIESMEDGASGSGQDRLGPSKSEDVGGEFFTCMNFVVLATHASLATAWLAFQLSLFSVVLAALASWFWVLAIRHGKRAARRFEKFDR